MCEYIVSTYVVFMELMMNLYSTEYPEFIKTPNNVTVKVGTTARFDCSAKGEPKPKIVWRKNGGTFLAANENRFHVMTADDVFFIAQVKPEDEGVYMCTASNSEGQISVNVTLTVQRKSTANISNVLLIGTGLMPIISCCHVCKVLNNFFGGKESLNELHMCF